MSFGRKASQPPAEPDNLGIEDEQFSTAEEAVPVPYFVGERKIALRWISRVYNQRTQQAPEERPGKK